MPDEHSFPTFRELPIDNSLPPGSAWGVFGATDQLGTLNLLTPERVLAAAGLVRSGQVFPLNWSLELPNPPLFSRQPLQHTIFHNPTGTSTDDRYDSFYTQTSSQWDALSHIGHPRYGFYNGCTLAEITGREGSRNGIDNFARHGIVGRFVLADVDRYRTTSGRPIRQGEFEPIDVDDIEATLAHQGVALHTGDILLLRFGWMAWYESLDQQARLELKSESPAGAGPGLAASEKTAAWLWDQHVAAVVADCPAVEALPFVHSEEGFLHFRLIPMLGLALGEMFDLEALAAECAKDRRYEGLFCAAPLNKVGGSGSTSNALAIK